MIALNPAKYSNIIFVFCLLFQNAVFGLPVFELLFFGFLSLENSTQRQTV